jgi:hypothetical protein
MDTKTITHKMEWVMAVGNARADGISPVAQERGRERETERDRERVCVRVVVSFSLVDGRACIGYGWRYDWSMASLEQPDCTFHGCFSEDKCTGYHRKGSNAVQRQIRYDKRLVEHGFTHSS